MENLHDFVVAKLQAAGRPEWDAIAAATGVSVHTIIKIANRKITSPRYVHIDPLARYFQRRSANDPPVPQAAA